MEEAVLSVRVTDLFSTEERFQGFRASAETDFLGVISQHMYFETIGRAEEDEAAKQVIPYVLIHEGRRIFVYQRSSGSGDLRLRESYSAGIGGHISSEDLGSQGRRIVRGMNMDDVDVQFAAKAISRRNPIRRGLIREVAEEVVILGRSECRFVGYINDDSDPVGRVHFGLLFLVQLASGSTARMREGSPLETSGALMDLTMVESVRWQLEGWSKIALDAVTKAVGFSITTDMRPS